MRAQLLTLENFMGTEHAEIELGSVNVVTGKNGAGKSTIVESLKAIVQGGSDASLIRKGSEFAKIGLVLEDGTAISKRFTGKGSTITVTDVSGQKIAKPQAYLDRITDALSVNPVAFLAAPENKRAEYLLEAMPLSVTAEQLREATAYEFEAADVEGHALDVIARIYKLIYDRRTGENRSLRDTQGTITKLEQALPVGGADPEIPWNEAVAQIESELAEKKKEGNARGVTVSTEASGLLTSVQSAFAEGERTARAELEQKLAALNQDRASDTQKINNMLSAERERIAAELQPEIDTLTASLATAKANRAQFETAERTRKNIETERENAAKLKAESERLSTSLENLDALKRSLLSKLPVPGLEIRDGQIFSDGVPFDRLNTAKRVAIAIKIARLRAGELGLICVDGLECLDSEMFAAFEGAAAKSGLQFVVTRVSDGPLTVSTGKAA